MIITARRTSAGHGMPIEMRRAVRHKPETKQGDGK